MANCAITSADSGIVRTTTPLERSESRVHRAGVFFSPLGPDNIVKFHFKAVAVETGKDNDLTIAVRGTRLVQINLSARGLRPRCPFGTWKDTEVRSGPL